MAIGARISSENLSGKTATVTFTPYTGTTSGTTVNLGTQTIPFNNITTHPYGNYAIYLAEYDYTYTLNIPEPQIDTQLFIWADRMVNDNNYGFATFNFSDLTATLIDFNVDSNLWSLNNLRPLNDSGFMYQFNGQNDNNDKLVIFTDATNAEIGRYTGNTSSYNINQLDGRWVMFEDENNGVFTYSNGINVYTYTYDSSRYNLDLQWDYDATMSDTSFVVVLYDQQNIDNHAYIFKSDGTQIPLKAWNYSDTALYYNFMLQYSDDFIVVEEISDIDGSKQKLEIFDTSANLLETVILSGTTYNNRNYGFHGTNKFYYITYDYNDINTAYKIIHYNFDTTTLIETSHARGNEYQQISTNSDSYYSDPVDRNVEGLVIMFYDATNAWDNWSYSVNFYDVMYMLGNDSAFSTYTYANNETKSINTWWYLSDVLRTKVTNGPNACVLTISGNTSHIEDLEIPVLSISNTNDWMLDNRAIYMVWNSDYINSTLFLIDENGLLSDQKSIEFTQQWGNYNTNNTGGKLFYGSFVTTSGNVAYYVNDSVTGFTETSFYNNLYDTWRFINPGQRDETTMVLFSEGGYGTRVLTANNISSEFTLPLWNSNYNFVVGRDKFLYVYNDQENNYFHAKLYDFSGNTINTLDTTETNLYGVYGGKDRFIVVFNNNDLGTRTVYMITPTSTENLTLQNNNTYYAPNDTYLWND